MEMVIQGSRSNWAWAMQSAGGKEEGELRGSQLKDDVDNNRNVKYKAEC